MIDYFLFLSIMIPIAWSPGANNIMCALLGSKDSWLTSLPFMIGLIIPMFIYSIIAGYSLEYMFDKINSSIFIIIQIFGVIFLYYLSYTIFTISKVELKEQNLPNSFYTGFLLSALNPKIFTAIFIMYSQFLIPNKSNYTLVLILSLSFIFISFIAELIWFNIGSFASSIFKSQLAIKMQNYIYSLMLAIVASWILYNTIRGLSNLYEGFI